MVERVRRGRRTGQEACPTLPALQLRVRYSTVNCAVALFVNDPETPVKVTV